MNITEMDDPFVVSSDFCKCAEDPFFAASIEGHGICCSGTIIVMKDSVSDSLIAELMAELLAELEEGNQ